MNTALLRAPDRLSHGVRPDDRHGRAHGPAPPLAADLLAALDALAPAEAAGAPAPARPDAAGLPGERPCTGFVILPRRRL